MKYVSQSVGALTTRRDCLRLAAGAGAALVLPLGRALAQDHAVITKPIPATGERLPIVGLGSSATFSRIAAADDVEAIRSVFTAMLDHGGTVFDTAPSYGASEEVAAQAANDLGVRDRLFWATKLNVAGRGGPADPARARQQVENSLARLGRDQIDLIQVHNVGDPAAQLPILAEYKKAGRVRYIGVTTTFKPQYATLEQLMRNEAFDFIGIDYAVDNPDAEARILPLAAERGIAVLGYMPFGRTRLWSRVEGHEVPSWAAEFGATTWAQFFLKFAASHPAVTVVTPATSRPQHMVDNMMAATGRLPDQAERRRMVELVEALPS
jgi:aryl-alcohol dehydrogenase-like predicted oxidoreductase